MTAKLANPGPCLFCDHPLNGRSKMFCTTCLPPLGEWDNKRAYHLEYNILRCAVGVGTEGMERCRIPKTHGAYLPPLPKLGPPSPSFCDCGVVKFGTARRCPDCSTIKRREAALNAWEIRAAQRPDDWVPSNNWRRLEGLRRRRKAALRSGTKPTVNRLAERDGWRCHLCNKRINPDLTGTKSKYKASIDHLIPLSAAGLDEMWNCKLAHLRCNSKRGAGGVAQLLLAV